MTFYIRKVKGQLHIDIIMFCKNTCWPLFSTIIQHHNSGRRDCDPISHLDMDVNCNLTGMTGGGVRPRGCNSSSILFSLEQGKAVFRVQPWM